MKISIENGICSIGTSIKSMRKSKLFVKTPISMDITIVQKGFEKNTSDKWYVQTIKIG